MPQNLARKMHCDNLHSTIDVGVYIYVQLLDTAISRLL